MRESEHDGSFDAVLQYLGSARGFDVAGYPRGRLLRHVNGRMRQLTLPEYTDYLDHLEVDGDEFAMLFNAVLADNAGFLGDPDAWERLRSHALPELLAARDPHRPIRVWSAGCGRGEEAYSLALLLAEALGCERFVRQVTVFATDIDDDALARARLGSYAPHEVAALPPDQLAAHFDARGGRFTVRPHLRAAVVVGRNDLAHDSPIPHVDLLACRNTLVYADPESQTHVLTRLQSALVPGGLLFLGRGEMLLDHAERFEPVDPTHRIFRRVHDGAGPATGLAWRDAGRRAGARDDLHSAVAELQTVNDDLRHANERLRATSDILESALTALAAPVVVLDADLRVRAWSSGAAELWGASREEATGANVLSLDLGVPADRLGPALRRAAAGERPDGTGVRLDGVDRRGRPLAVRAVCGNGGGAVLVVTAEYAEYGQYGEYGEYGQYGEYGEAPPWLSRSARDSRSGA